MKLYFDNNTWIDTEKPIDISYPFFNDDRNNNAWYCHSPVIEPVRTDDFLGSVAEGGPVNFRNIAFNPHGNGTHTECVGHIAEEVYSINERLKNFFFKAELITVAPQKKTGFGEDLVIDKDLLQNELNNKRTEALVIRTLFDFDKQGADYSNTNPPYLTVDAMKYIIEIGIQHLLIDLPSVDREQDGGRLLTHHLFWNYPQSSESAKTITELIFVSDNIKEGSYLLNLMISPFENDAAPSKPVLYEIFT